MNDFSMLGYSGTTGLILTIMVYTIIITPWILIPLLFKISSRLKKIEQANKKNTPR